MNRREIGKLGEKIAENFLVDKNYQIIDRNFHFGRLGEIDLIAKDDDEYVFVEVKLVNNLDYGYPENRITSSKKSKLRKAAEGWMFQNNIYDQPCRFDVIGIISEGNDKEITHYINAF